MSNKERKFVLKAGPVPVVLASKGITTLPKEYLEGGIVSKKDFIAREEIRSSQIYKGLAKLRIEYKCGSPR